MANANGDFLVAIRGTGYGGMTSGRGGDTFPATRSRRDPFTESVEILTKPGGLIWGPEFGTAYLTPEDKRAATSMGVKVSGLRGSRPGMATYVLVKV